MVRVRVLGPLEVVDGDRPVSLGGPKERRLLAALAIHAGEVVSESRLIDALWGDNPPRTATKTLQNYVLRLRKVLHRQADEDGDGLTIVTIPPGYMLQGSPSAIDSLGVAARMASAREAVAAGEYSRATALLDETLSCWRGPSLVEFADEPFAMAEAARLDELRQVAIEDRVDAELALGHHQECVAELEALIAENPLRERRWGQLMLALYRSGRQADALRAYQRARSTLVEELGIEPGPELRRLERAIFDQDPSLDLPVAATAQTAVAAHRPIPAETDEGRTIPLPPAMAHQADAVFVGRQSSLEQLAACWERARNGERQVAVVRGEPGIGKTSTARILATEAHRSGAVVLYGRCEEELAVPYQPVADALRWYVHHRPPAELAGELGPLGGELVRIIPELADAVGGLPPPVGAEPAVERYRLFEAVVGLLSSISSRCPVVLVLDDLHWAAKSTLLLLRHLVQSTLLNRLLVVALCRDAGPEVTPHLGTLLGELHRESGVEQIPLAGLDEAESIALVEERTGQQLVPAEAAIVRALYGQTGGNPFFIGEIVRHLIETGAVYRQDGLWRSDQRLEDIELPEGVRGLLRQRLSRLSAGSQRALAVGAVAGAAFTLDLLERVQDAADNADALLDALDEAVVGQVLVELPGAPGRYTFAHALVRQVLLQDLTAARRARLHLRVGEAYESLPNPTAHLGALAHHFAEAGHADRAADYALAAGLEAVGRVAFEVAVAYLERGLRCLDEAPAPDRARRVDLLVALADARRLVGDLAGSREAALRAADDARAVGSAPHLAAAAMLQVGLGVAGKPDPAVDSLCGEALAALGDDATGLRIQVLARLALHRALWEGRAPEGGALAEEALTLARGLGDPDPLQDALWARAISLVGSPAVDERQALGDELVAMAERLGNPRVLGRGLRMRAMARLEQGDMAGFDADVAALERHGTEHRDWKCLSETARWRTLRALLEGRFDAVEEISAEMVAHGGNDVNVLNAHASQLFFLRREQGRLAEALSLVDGALERTPGVPVWRALLALGLVELERTEDARDIFDSLVADDFAGVPSDFTRSASLCLLSNVCAVLGDAPRAEALLHLYRPYSGQLAVLGWGNVCAGAVDRFLGMLEATAGRLDDAEAFYRAALELEERVGARPFVVRTRIWYALAVGQRGRLGDDALAERLLAQARAEAASLGMLGAVPVGQEHAGQP
jgi:DNA-binding SARP family transcriptional activator